MRGNPLLGVISEAGLYALIMRSSKPDAQPFRHWVTRDLPPPSVAGTPTSPPSNDGWRRP
ncbi:BRO family protein [Kitasatospora sp. NPDC058243]|uniref:BRO family protein n=1 Tax=Kitasatospora sp. NPDC058243 TaxID=3346397 RepID=UPI0036DB501B